jgi:hypothetical protein
MTEHESILSLLSSAKAMHDLGMMDDITWNEMLEVALSENDKEINEEDLVLN